MTIVLPADIRDLDEDEFVLGTDSEDEESERELDIDDIFGKDLETVVADIERYHPTAEFEEEKFDERRSSDIDPSLVYATHETLGTFLFDEEGAIVGGFLETDLVLADEHQGQGIGREIVVEHFLSNGALPTWYLDSAQYSRAGYGACCSAHQFPRSNKASYVAKLVDHIARENHCVDNESDRLLLSTILESRTIKNATGDIEAMISERSLLPMP